MHFSHFLSLQTPYLSPPWVTEQILLFLIRYRVMRPYVSCFTFYPTWSDMYLCQPMKEVSISAKPLCSPGGLAGSSFLPSFSRLCWFLCMGSGPHSPLCSGGCWRAGQWSRGQPVLWELSRGWTVVYHPSSGLGSHISDMFPQGVMDLSVLCLDPGKLNLKYLKILCWLIFFCFCASAHWDVTGFLWLSAIWTEKQFRILSQRNYSFSIFLF